MPFPRRLDAALRKLCRLSKKDVRAAIRSGRVAVDGARVGLSQTTRVNQFSRLELDGAIVHEKMAYYIMLHKPAGVVSARNDADKVCAVDILARGGFSLGHTSLGHTTSLMNNSSLLVPFRNELSIAGRLDRSTTGLLLLTNDGHWMRRIMDGRQGTVEKEYRVTTRFPLPDLQAASAQFLEGLHLPGSKLPDNKRICRPARLKKLMTLSCGDTTTASKATNPFFEEDCTYSISLCEGKRHQVKRMIHAVSHGKNRVVALHRMRIGNLVLDEEALPLGAWRFLTGEEVANF
jgi:16S rRNA pseudouridine516 synthase